MRAPNPLTYLSLPPSLIRLFQAICHRILWRGTHANVVMRANRNTTTPRNGNGFQTLQSSVHGIAAYCGNSFSALLLLCIIFLTSPSGGRAYSSHLQSFPEACL